ncbi:hypothetical protein I302_100229 [Kwoniella bestiolae CBS 10118]|uniref:N-acetyltransferase domain-containing protein n=1 Tax=Kwoniella bestiolae CBS 10118 TaxID=1296100 RepID=A0A1B9G4F1_9TREE|nr:hypothetical protein I302_03603 [Kwoniella bestiolae CBS 10118]OCF25927.1 hypothetical protein I302_03603 [Kwoniella bestiolae CBS 10118]
MTAYGEKKLGSCPEEMNQKAHLASKLFRKLRFNKARAIELSCLQVREEARSLGHGKALLEQLRATSEREHRSFYQFVASERAITLYEREGCEVKHSTTFSTQDFGECNTAIMEYIPRSGVVKRKEDDIASLAHRITSLHSRCTPQ